MIRGWIVGIVGGCLACAPNHQFTDTSRTAMALASINPSLATFVTMLDASGVSTLLRASNAVTVLAPNNVAINALGADRVRFLLSDEGAEELAEFVNAYVFPGAYSGEDIARGKLPLSLAGKRITTSKASDGLPRVEGTGKILESMKGSNGYVHVIDVMIR
jgi:uncharacterized surface protein with fasciclin (FAS1) repeats